MEFLVLTRWDTMEAIRRFTGTDTGKAVVEPAAQAVLSSFDSHVRHYEVLQEVPQLVAFVTVVASFQLLVALHRVGGSFDEIVEATVNIN